MAVQAVKRRGKRRLVIDIRYANPDGTPGRFRRDAEVQTMAAARAEDRRRLAALAVKGSPTAVIDTTNQAETPAVEASSKPSPCFKDVVDRYLKEFAPSRLKPSTRTGYSVLLSGEALRSLSKLPVGSIDANVIRQLDVKLVEKGLTASTRRNVQTAIRSVLCRFAVEADILDEAPKLPRMPKVGSKVASAPSDDEVHRILGAASQIHRPAFMLAAFAGLRGGEVRGLRRSDVDLPADRLVVRQTICRGVISTPKSGHERMIPLVPELKEELAKSCQSDRAKLVTVNSKGRTWTEAALLMAFLRACRRANVREWRFHDLRHYFVTALFRSGASAPTVQALAGHADLSTTQRYAHAADRDLTAAIKRFAGNRRVTDRKRRGSTKRRKTNSGVNSPG